MAKLLFGDERCPRWSSSLREPLDLLDERRAATTHGIRALRLLHLPARGFGSDQSAVDEFGPVASGE